MGLSIGSSYHSSFSSSQPQQQESNGDQQRLIAALKSNDLSKVKISLAQTHPNFEFSFSEAPACTPLQYASRYLCKDIVKEIILAGAKSSQDCNGMNALHYAIGRFGNVFDESIEEENQEAIEIVKILCDSKVCNLNEQDVVSFFLCVLERRKIDF